MCELRARHLIKQFARQLAAGTATRRAVIHTARLRLRISNEIFQVGRRHRCVDSKRNAGNRQQGNRRKILDRVVIKFLEQKLRCRVRADVSHGQRVTVGRRLGADFGADDAAGAGPVIDNNLLAPNAGELVRQKPRHDV